MDVPETEEDRWLYSAGMQLRTAVEEFLESRRYLSTMVDPILKRYAEGYELNDGLRHAIYELSAILAEAVGMENIVTWQRYYESMGKNRSVGSIIEAGKFPLTSDQLDSVLRLASLHLTPETEEPPTQPKLTPKEPQ